MLSQVAQSNEISSFDKWTLGIAITGAVLALVSLGIQYLGHRRGTPRVSVDIEEGIEITGGIVSSPDHWSAERGPKLLVIRAKNHAAAPITVSSVSLRKPDDSILFTLGMHPRSSPLPARIEGFDAVTWAMSVDPELLRRLETENDPLLRGQVKLAIGPKATSRNGIHVLKRIKET